MNFSFWPFLWFGLPGATPAFGPQKGSIGPLWEGLQNHRQGSIEPFASKPPFSGYPFKFLPTAEKPLTVSKRVPGPHGKRGLERGWQKRLAKGWRWVSGLPCTLQFRNSRGARLETRVCDSMAQKLPKETLWSGTAVFFFFCKERRVLKGAWAELRRAHLFSGNRTYLCLRDTRHFRRFYGVWGAKPL